VKSFMLNVAFDEVVC